MKIMGGQASAAPPVGSTLGQYGVNMMDFIQPFNDATSDMRGQMVTAHITIFDDRSLAFRVVGSRTVDRLRAEVGIKKGSGKPNSEKVGTISKAKIEEIAKTKLQDLNTTSLESAIRTIEGTARQMGLTVE